MKLQNSLEGTKAFVKDSLRQCARLVKAFGTKLQPRSQGCIRTTLAQSSDSSILIGRKFLYRTPTNS